MTTSYLNISDGQAGNEITANGWVNATPTADVAIPLNQESDNTANGWQITFGTAVGPTPGTDGATVDGTGGAAWAKAPSLKKSIGAPSTSVLHPIVFSGLDNTKTYDIRLVSSIDISGRQLLFVHGAEEQVAPGYDSSSGAPNVSQSAWFEGLSPVDGSITIEWRSYGGETGYLSAVGITDERTASIVLDQTTLTPGATISGSYSNFAGVPTGSLALSDSNNNPLDVTVTITDNGDGTGTFTGTMPALPAQGASAAGLLFGTVTAELIDPDTTAPVLTAATVTSPAAGQIDGTVDTDESDGTLYYVATVNATETLATVKAGSSQAVSTAGTQSVSVTGLAAGTYYMHFAHTDQAGNDSAVLTSGSVVVA